ncbi:MAG: AI-2E family transporter, partial [Gemmatimonadota bacterium]
MAIKNSALSRPRVAFLLVLALAVTLLFFWVIKGFLLALLLGAIMAALLHPFYGRIVERLGGREGLGSGVTEHSDELTRQIEADPDYQKLLPYQEEISEKAGQLAGRVGTFVARELANFVQATAGILLLLFVMLYAMFYFLIDGRTILDATLKYTPLSDDDKTRLLGTFTSVSRATLKGTLVIGIVQGGLAGLAFWVAGIQGAVFWGSVMAVLSIIPGIGTALV